MLETNYVKPRIPHISYKFRIDPGGAARVVPQVQQFAERYFGGWSGALGAVASQTALPDEPSARPSEGPLYYEEASLSGPAALHAYYRPGLPGTDSVALDAIRHAQPCYLNALSGLCRDCRAAVRLAVRT